MVASLEAYAEDNGPWQVRHPKEQADRVNLIATRCRGILSYYLNKPRLSEGKREGPDA